MNTNLQDRIDDLFAGAIELPPDERRAFLSSSCDDDTDLLAEVEKLLSAHERAEQSPEFLASMPKAAGTSEEAIDSTNDPLIGQQIGPYVVKERLGGGGFGDVYLAARTKEYQQLVAIKVVRDQARDLPRFELERQLLADLQHEHIARILDGGTIADGRPFIVMEYIAGQPITKYCDERLLPIKQRLALFAQVCQALAFAHRYGVIHRDIKPDNILVTDQGDVKLLDFGIAKMLVSRAGTGIISSARPAAPAASDGAETVSMAYDSSLPGPTGSALGLLGPMTPAYASPEQVLGQEVSTASDIYSLGIVLYELLVGCRPYDTPRFRPDPTWLAELQRVVCEQEPPALSGLVSGLPPKAGSKDDSATASPDALAAVRGTTPKKLQKLLNGDLESIALKTLRKAPERRYAAVESLLDDLGRFDRGYPVDARPVSRRERAVRWVGRNKLVATLASTAVLALVAGAIASTLFGLDARRQAAAAIARETETAAVLDLVEDKVFAAARPEGQEGGLGHDVTLRQAVESALPYIEKSFTKQPLIEARLRMRLGETFFYLGEAQTASKQYEIARSLLTDELGLEHPDTLDSINSLAGAYYLAGRLDEALPLFEQSLSARRNKLGADHPDTLKWMGNLASAYRQAGRVDDALSLFEQTLAAQQKQLGADHPDTLVTINNLATVYRDAGRLHESLTLYEQTVAVQHNRLGADHPDTLTSMNYLASAYNDAGRVDEALSLYKETLAARQKKLGPDHPDTLTSMNNLANVYSDVGRLEEAVSLYKETLARQKKKLGADHPSTLSSLNNLARAYFTAGLLNEALPLFEQSLAARQKKLGPDHPDTLASMNNLANVYSDVGRLEEAVSLYKETLAARQKKLGANHPDTLASMNNLASVYSVVGRQDKAISLYKETLTLGRTKLGADHPNTLTSLNNLAGVYITAGRVDEALSLYKETLAARQNELGADHPDTLTLLNNLAAVYSIAGRMDDAVRLYEQTLAARRKTLGEGHPDTLYTMIHLAYAKRAAGRPDDARRIYEQLLVLRPDDTDSLNCFAWLLATSPADEVRDGSRAIELAERACQLTKHQNSDTLETLAAAHAETGDFESAVKWSQKAIDLLQDKTDPKIRDRLEKAHALYKDNKPMREEGPTTNAEKLQKERPAKTAPDAAAPVERAAQESASTGDKYTGAAL